MTISSGDIKLIASSVMDDVPEGGGAPSATIIEDATTNTIFPDISELDRAIGRVNLRKVFAQVRTADTDGFFGANIIVTEPFKDPRVSATLFTTGDVFDRRAEAASRMEAYLARGTTYPGYLFGDHLAGQSVVTLLQTLDTPLPVVGDTLVLTKNQGLSNEFVQFVRIVGVTATERSFTDAPPPTEPFKRNQVVCAISDQLLEDFFGFDAIRVDAALNYTGKTRINESTVADAARYYGTVPLTAAVAIGDFSVQAEGIFTQLVPSTRIEVPIADARMNQRLSLGVAASGDVVLTPNLVFAPGSALYIGGQIAPGSLTVVRDSITLQDRGGRLFNGSTQVGLVDYDNGVLTLSIAVFSGSAGTHTVTYKPAVTPSVVNQSVGLDVTQESQRLSWVLTLEDIPVRGSLQVSFRAQGRWYVLQDDGSGALRGSSTEFGAGTVNFTTGTVSLTLGALPDVGSKLLLLWAKSESTTPAESARTAVSSPSGSEVRSKATYVFQFAPTGLVGLKPGTVTFSWNDGTARTATDNGTNGLAGAATGRVDYGTGTIRFQPNVLPPVGTVLTVTATETTAVQGARPAFTDAGANWTLSLGAGVKANSVRFSIQVNFSQTDDGTLRFPAQTLTVWVFDDGAGSLRASGSTALPTIAVGTVNYATGLITVGKTAINLPVWVTGYRVLYTAGAPGTGFQSSYSSAQTEQRTANVVVDQSASGLLTYALADGASGVVRNFTMDSMVISLLSNDTGVLRAGPQFNYGGAISRFVIGTDVYTIVGMTSATTGVVKRNVNPSTGAATTVGSAATSSFSATLTTWPTGVNSVATDVRAAVVPESALAGGSVDTAVFRSAVSPLVNSGFQIVGNWLEDNVLFSGTANASGHIITGSAVVGSTPGSRGVFGKVDYTNGIIELRFGRRVPASMATDPNVIDVSYLALPGVQYLELQHVIADTLRYNASGYTYLPLDSEILGLNPVRLPADGRVPIFRTGSVAVLGHTGEVGPATVANAQVVNCGRTRLSRVRVIGNNGAVINTGYTTDLDAGTVTFTNVSGYSQPVTVEHRIEDTVLVSDAQISGQISFTRPSTHVYPTPGSYISSALVAGDVRARVQPAFDQVSWTNVWSDSPIGAAATGSYNDTLHPIATSNAGALTERWALIFTNTTAFNIVGEHIGVIGTGNTGVDTAPLNPATGQPYFTLQSEGWGLGWATGNVLRFNTVGATVPVWVSRTILQGPETVPSDDFTLLIRGDVDRP